MFGTLSAKVGSISDNQAGGWYAYRAAKAASNMLVKCAAIEARRTHPGWRVLALHPGTVVSPLSDPFMTQAKRAKLVTTDAGYDALLRGAGGGAQESPYVYWTPDVAAGKLFDVMNAASVARDSGKLLDYAGREIPP